MLFLIAVWTSFKEGFVEYRTVLKAFGALPDPVSGKSYKLYVETSLKEDSTFVLSFKVPVMSFRSGNSTRDKEVAKILGYPKHKYIHFNLISHPKDIVSRVLNSESGKFNVKAELKVKGKSSTYTWDIEYRWISKDELELTTSRHVKFTDFGISPPSLFGFVKRAPDDVEVRGKIILEVKR